MAFQFKKWTWHVALLSTLSSISYADKVAISFFDGTNFSKLSGHQQLAINNFMTNEYQIHSTTNHGGFWGLGFSHTFEKLLKAPYQFSLGFAGYSLNMGTVNGIEYPFVNAGTFDSLNYRFHINSAVALIEPRLAYTIYGFQPFILGGVGYAWNRFSQYTETPTNPLLSAAAIPNTFRNHTEQNLAYEFGFGVQYLLYDDKRHQFRYLIAADYRYINLGKGQLGGAAAQTSHDHMHINNMDTQSLAMSLTLSSY